MKKILIFIFMVLIVMTSISFSQDEPTSETIGTNSVLIAPDRRNDQSRDPAFVPSTVYAQGDRVLVPNIQSVFTIYWAVNAGTGTNAPGHTSGDQLVDDIVWRIIPTGVNRRPIPRERLEIISLSTNNIFFAVGFDANINEGIVLTGSGGAFTYDGQFAVFAISSQTNELITIQDR